MFKIMIVEDDESIQKELRILLQTQGYQVVCWDFTMGIAEIIKVEDPHIVLLDINLPNMDGFSVCTQIRGFSNVPIIFVTSRDSDMDELCSMTLGGDDFIKKPYNTSILLARISALLKRSYEKNDQTLTHNNIILDIALSKVIYEDKACELTKNEVKIMNYLFMNKGHIVSRDDLIDYLWDNKLFIDDNALSVNIARIRTKLKDIGVENFIVTKHRQGYVI